MDAVTTLTLSEFKREGRKITALTAYDAPFARIMDRAGVDVILVGDSVGMTVLGRADTLSVTLDEMIHHARSVVSAVERALVVVDMPFMSFQVSVEKAVENAGRLIKETGAKAVKLEGDKGVEKTVRAIVEAGIPVMGHVGLRPQSIHKFGGFKVQGRESGSAKRIELDAKATENGGGFAVVIEAVPVSLAKQITESLNIPTIGIGAGMHCDGQILVMHDVLGISDNVRPRFAKRYASVADIAQKAFREYIEEVKGGKFPTMQHSYSKLKLIKKSRASTGI
ncbi:MAG: 3-methyl-2-oxobutanoate hydroxymethyltransferase [bacterium]|nr:MAG: 3-methyl-2-oxobutanoate hydroxymethyltransferase [bacterium]